MTDLALPDSAHDAILSHDLAPRQSIHSPGKWVRENLFSSVGNGVQTLAFALVLLGILRWILVLIFAEERDWHAVTTNMRLMFTNNYPTSQYGRIWFTFAALLVTGMLTIGAFNFRPRYTVRKTLINLAGTGAVVAVLGLLSPIGFTPRLVMVVVGVAVAVALTAYIQKTPHLDEHYIPFWQALLAIAALLLLVIWFVPFGNDRLVNLEAVLEPGTILTETKLWLSLMIAVTVGALFLGRLLYPMIPDGVFSRIMIGWWALGPAFLIFFVVREPEFDWNRILTVDIPLALAFGIGGAALLYFLAIPGNEVLARIAGMFVLAVGVGTFVLGATGTVSMPQKVRLSLLALGLAGLLAPTFAGESRVRLRFALLWAGTVAISHLLITGINTPNALDLNSPNFLGGFMISVTLGYYVMLASFPVGILMALARTSKMPLFRVMSTFYIEVVRGVPLIVILFFFDNLLNLFLPSGMSVSKIAGVFLGFTLFSAAYMAENIRGGLQSVRQGQFEASDALGLTTLQRTVFIILPQALRVSIPNLVGQAIATFKETSLVSIIGAFDILYIARNVVPSQTAFIGHSIAPLLFVSAVYWIFAYSMSRASRTLEMRLGVGSR